MTPVRRYAFNFAASYGWGGGFRRLFNFVKWFDAHGGAWFIIHPRCVELLTQFPRNRFIVARQSRYMRVLHDCPYLDDLLRAGGIPELYYTYGVPLYERVGHLNWFHVCNVLPLERRGIPLAPLDRVRFAILGRRTKASFVHADVISAESLSTLGLIDGVHRRKLRLSANGSDDELAALREPRAEEHDNLAVIVGTHRYKAVEEGYAAYRALRAEHRGLRLAVIGNPSTVPRALRRDPDVAIRGILPRPEVLACLAHARFYISTTLTENSSNADSEGVYLASESFLSDIAPHRELLRNVPAGEVLLPGLRRPLLHVCRSDLDGRHLRTWDAVVEDVVTHAESLLGSPPEGHPGCGEPHE